MDEEQVVVPYTREELAQSEEDIARALIASGDALSGQTMPIDVSIGGKHLFTFHIKPLSEQEFDDCQRACTMRRANPRLGGLKMPEDMNTTRYRSMLIYYATVEADRKRYWDNRQAIEHYKCNDAFGLIDRVLPAGYKAGVVEQIEKISGYGAELGEAVKN